MRIVVAPDSFKESLTAIEAADHIQKGLKNYNSSLIVETVPISDGGEGMAETIVNATKDGVYRNAEVLDPLLREIHAQYGIINNGTTAVIEMAQASGLQLLSREERDILNTSTFGTGQLIKDALDEGCNSILLGLGGSATNDGGTGMAKALGIKFLDKYGEELSQGGGSLKNLDRIDFSKIDKRVASCQFIGVCDVSNPLTGPKGATYVYGPQKGGSNSQLKEVEEGMITLASIMKKHSGLNPNEIEGSGAAGGLGAGIVTFLNGTVKKGFPLIAEIIELEEKIKNADLMITGEGSFDSQSMYGKATFGVLELSKTYGKPVIIICGVNKSSQTLLTQGVAAIHEIRHENISLEESISQASALIEERAFTAIKEYLEVMD